MSLRNLEATTGSRSVVADVCVIGGGMAGMIAARRIAGSGRRVVLLESGGFDGQMMDATAVSEVESDEPAPSWVDGRARGLGGTSSLWGGRLVPLARDDTGSRDYIGVDAWPFDICELNSYLPDVEDLFGLDHTSYEEDVLPQLKQHPLRAGDPWISVRVPKLVPFRRCNLGTLLNREFRDSRRIDGWLNATVTNFSVDRSHGTLRGVTARTPGGARLDVTAREFVIAAGTIESTRLLLLIDAECEGRIFSECRALGRYLQEHVELKVASIEPHDRPRTNEMLGYRFLNSVRRGLHFVLTRRAQEEQGVASAYGHTVFHAPESSPTLRLRSLLRGLKRSRSGSELRRLGTLFSATPELVVGASWLLLRKTHYWPPDLKHDLHLCVEQAPKVSNRIALSQNRDEFGTFRTRIDWRVSEDEERTVRHAIRHIATYWSRSGLDRYCGLDRATSGNGSDPWISHSRPMYHPSGTTRAGVSRVNSVVDSSLRCHELQNVSIASASTFPSAGSANPTLTVLLLAMRVADSVVGSLERSS